ncbi:DNA excision repair protein ERCC-6-like [Trichonephila inaurata madagascariensis]|uniref:DNA repair and recombination protein RAD54-like n=1 Tax=Trichonephila inaurata madagascariensis TaxID=2747483 RepID=A0A8X6YG61_9ARAC|nr:DNA excision repair protein ERCC-6-like [Trichonephila inaurata madagascariensis]
MSSDFQRFEQLQSEGKRLAAEGKLIESLRQFQLARKIKETPKILSRIQKLKDAIAQSEPRIQENSSNQMPSVPVRKSNVTPEVLSQIQNIQGNHEKLVPVNPADLSPVKLKRFQELKTSAIEFSYDGKFEKALHNFSEAQKLCNCPKVKKYMEEIEALILKYPKKLETFLELTDTGKKLASAGKQTESLEKLKTAFAVCPSPKVSKMIKMLETDPRPSFSNVIPAYQKENNIKVSMDGDHSKICSLSNALKENQFTFLKSGSSDTDVSLAPVSHSQTEVNDPAELSPETKIRFKTLYSQAREDAASGRLQEALDTLEKAKTICPTDKILKRIKDLKEYMKTLSMESSSDMTEVCEGFFIFHEIYEKLYPYQREGVAWMYELYKMKRGGVLGDDMGLGKTFQVIAFLSGLIDADLIKHILIIMPVSLLPNWEKEFKRWCPGISVTQFHGGSKKERERNLLKVQRRGHVLLTSYGMVLNALGMLAEFDNRPFVWDYVILDEGHKIKNPTKTTKAVHALPSRNRLVLTGTPVQNNLLELWALYDFVHQGTLLGSLKTFKMQYENVITRAREKDSTVGEKRLGTEMANNLKMLIRPYFLRRTKSEVWGKESENTSDLENGIEKLRIAENRLNTRKNDLIIWTYLSDAQCEIYRNFLHSQAVRMILVSKRSPLVELTTLKKICDHPRLLSQRACLQLGLNGELNEEDLHRELEDESTYSSSIENVTDETLIAESGKMKFLIKLLENLKNEGHRTLVFSLSRKILDMVHRILTNRKWKVMRIDGSISKIEERERRIQSFQSDTSYSVFLLTTQVGGVGITLTSADRVVIYDPSWNPATDAQAVDRAYRIGQEKNVIVYRLITCGTVEEKIYRRQIFKDSITKQATCSSDPYRYFSKQELRELFTFDSPFHSATQVQLSQLHSDQRCSDVELDAHIAFLHSLDIFGISDHDLMFSKDIEDNSEDTNQTAVSHDFIKRQVAVAQERIQIEASVVAEGIRLAGTFSRPFSEHIPSTKKSESQKPSIGEVVDLIKNDDKKHHTDFGLLRKSKENSHVFETSPSMSKPKAKYQPLSLKNSQMNSPSEVTANFSTNASSTISEVSTPSHSLKCNNDSEHSVFEPESKNLATRENLVHDLEAMNKSCDIEIISDSLTDDNTSKDFCDPNIKNTNDSVNVDPVSNEFTAHISEKEGVSYLHTFGANNDSIQIINDTQNSMLKDEDVVKSRSFQDQMQEIKVAVSPKSNFPQNESALVSDKSNLSVLISDADMPGTADLSPIRSSISSESAPFESCEDQDVNEDCQSGQDSESAKTSPQTHSALDAEPVLSGKYSLDDTAPITNVDNLNHSTPKRDTETVPYSDDCKSQLPVISKIISSRQSSNPTNLSTCNFLEDLSFDDKPSTQIYKRKSCAKPREFVVSDSDSSRPSSPLDQDEIIVSSDSYSDADNAETQNSSCSLSFVPSSIPNSPSKIEKTFRNTSEVSRSSSYLRITPLKVRKSQCPPPDRAFAFALATSPIISLPIYRNDSDADSPVAVIKKKNRNIIESDED